MRFLSVDPGTSHTGWVVCELKPFKLVEHGAVNYREPVHSNNQLVSERINEICDHLRIVFDVTGCSEIVCEGFSYLPSRFKASSLNTVWLCGAIAREFEKDGITFQTSRAVLNPKTPGNAAIVKKHPEKFGGGECRNDHERSAFAHAFYYYQGGRAWRSRRERR